MEERDLLQANNIDIVGGQGSWEEDSRVYVDGHKWFGEAYCCSKQSERVGRC